MDNTPFIAPYVPCHPDVGAAAVEFAEVSSNDVLVDLGETFFAFRLDVLGS